MTALRRWAVALAGAAALSAQVPTIAQVPSWSREAQQRLVGGPGTDSIREVAERQRLAEAGESALARGDTEAAERAFESAARMVHSADIEMGLVRTYMQAGDYRRALTFASHAAGAHRNVPAGTALYGWLLHIGGQGVVARRYVDDALSLWPDDPALRECRTLLGTSNPLPDGPLKASPLRALPYAVPAIVAPGARTAGTALLLADGRHAVVPAATVRSARRVWLRNGMGRTVTAEVDPATSDEALVVLRLDSELPAVPWLKAPPREPFAGSPAYTVEYVSSKGADATWPLLHLGFLGRALDMPGERLLGIELAPGPRGGPVFDAQGHLVGMALPGGDGRDRFAGLQALARPAAGGAATASEAAPVTSTNRVAADEIYEVAMRLALQVLVLP